MTSTTINGCVGAHSRGRPAVGREPGQEPQRLDRRRRAVALRLVLRGPDGRRDAHERGRRQDPRAAQLLRGQAQPPGHRRLRVKPGITGLWQVSGRDDLDWEKAVRLDLYYV
ncbi:hypothetical protein CRM73_17395, partial [Kocuria sp. CCUG 69068]|nr:hypothetical protein [Kocuria sp. CCUG 69068]